MMSGRVQSSVPAHVGAPVRKFFLSLSFHRVQYVPMARP